jgi:hypothetical protein
VNYFTDDTDVLRDRKARAESRERRLVNVLQTIGSGDASGAGGIADY